MDKTSFTLGWLVGRRIAGQRGKRTPIAYLYGKDQVRLPPLPEWDIETYPHAVIACNQNGIYFLFAFTVPVYKEAADLVLYAAEGGAYRKWAGGSNWIGMGTTDFTAGEVLSLTNGSLVWANHDILYKESTEVCIATSDPIPVYE